MKVLTLDDHPVINEYVKQNVLRLIPTAEIFFANKIEQARALVSTIKIDIAFIDFSLPDGNGFDFIQLLLKKNPEAKVAFYSQMEEELWLSHILNKFPEISFISKLDSIDCLSHALEAFSNDEKYYSPSIKLKIENKIKNKQFDLELIPKLTRRESEVLPFIAKGLTNAQIAEKLYISLRTVHDHRANLLVRFNANNTAELIDKARRLHFL